MNKEDCDKLIQYIDKPKLWRQQASIVLIGLSEDSRQLRKTLYVATAITGFWVTILNLILHILR